MKIIVSAIVFTLLTAFGFASDRSIAVQGHYGNLVETKDRHGADTTVRDRYEHIVGTRRCLLTKGICNEGYGRSDYGITPTT